MVHNVLTLPIFSIIIIAQLKESMTIAVYKSKAALPIHQISLFPHNLLKY
jgi:hypothetical protein